MSIIVGRRRIEKTSLIKKAFEQKVYLFVSKKSEMLLCEEFISIIEKELGIKVLGEHYSFTKLFKYLLELAKERHFILVIDGPVNQTRII